MKNFINKIKENKSFIAPWVVLAVSIILFAFGLTYAYFNFSETSQEESSLKVTATNLLLSLEASTINVTGMMPIYDDYRSTQAEMFNFSIENESRKVSACYELDLIINSIDEELESDMFKWELTNNTTSNVVSGNFASISDDKIIMSIDNSIGLGVIHDYTLRLWISNSSSINQNFLQNASLSSKIIMSSINGTCSADVTYNYEYSGIPQEFIAPTSGRYQIELWGAEGGGTPEKAGGKGGYTSGIIELDKSEKLYVYVGGTGKAVTTGSLNYVDGGYNGGGTGGSDPSVNSFGGGGATDIRTVSGSWNNTASLNSRIMIAAGGGGNVSETTGNAGYAIAGAAGGLTGFIGTASDGTYATDSYYANGGTQSTGGVNAFNTSKNGLFGYALQTSVSDWGGGGGGGYYGGAQGNGTGGGGGSSYISGHAGCLINANGTFQSTIMKDGVTSMTSPYGLAEAGHSGPGYARISLLPVDLTINLDGGSQSADYSDKKFYSGVQYYIVPPTKNNYSFVGWTITGIGASVSGNRITIGLNGSTITALWQNVALTVNLNGGQTTQTFQSRYPLNTSITLVNPTRDQYTFTGWTVTGSGSSINNVTRTLIINNNDTVLNANWAKTVTTYAYNGTNGSDGSVRTYPILYNGTYDLKVWGAQGGYRGGAGGYATGRINLTAGSTLYVYVGGAGRQIGASTSSIAGGYNGGGYGHAWTDKTVGSGGGATDIRLNGTALSNRIIVAGGGGAGGYQTSAYYGNGGAGGGTSGGTGSVYGQTTIVTGKGGTQSSAGGGHYAGTLGVGAQTSSTTFGGGYTGGGGGYYGGGAGKFYAGAGGGSGYIGGVSSGSMSNGVRTGHGYAEITIVSVTF